MNEGPKRIQRKRTKGWTMPPNAIYVGRPTIYGNPWSVAHYGEQAMTLFRRWLNGKMRPSELAKHAHVTHSLRYSRERLLGGVAALRDKDLACWCGEGMPCHADILLELANQ